MFRPTMCPSSVETTVFIRHLVLVILYGSIQNNKYQVSHKHSCYSWWWAHSRLKYVEVEKYSKNKYTKNKLCNKYALFTKLYRDARSTKHKNWLSLFCLLLSAASLLFVSPFVTHCFCPFIPSPCLCSNLFDCIVCFMFLTYSDRRPSESQSCCLPRKQIRVIALAWLESPMPLFLHLRP